MSRPTTTIPKGSWVLITGVNGHLGAELAKQFLERGYRVRGTVRDLSRSSWLINDVFTSYAASGHFEVVSVTDIAAEGAFDASIKGVSAVAHVATPGFDPDPNKVVTPAVASTSSILKAAAAEPSVNQFLLTSSIVAAAWLAPENRIHVTRDSWNDAALDVAWAPPPYEPTRIFPVYMASKVAAEKELWRFVAGEKPDFAVNSVCPQTILGKRLNKSCTSPTASILPALFEGQTAFLMNTVPAMSAVDVKDVALLHVAAVLDPEVNGERIQAWGQPCTWNEALAILRRLFPRHKFIDDLADAPSLSMTTDTSYPLGLLKKWGGQDGWRNLEETFLDNLDHVSDE